METEWDDLRLEQTAQQRVVVFHFLFFCGYWLVGWGRSCLFVWFCFSSCERVRKPPSMALRHHF